MRGNTVYDNPETFGLTLLGFTDLAEPNCSFDILAVWKDEKGYYLATDSGCSCLSPFESFYAVTDLTGPLTAEQAKDESLELWRGYFSEYDPESFWGLMALVE
jgi:hypothetical protein